jgi:amidase
MKDVANALVSQFTTEGSAKGPLAGLSFVAKDLYDIEGYVTGCGNPDWAATHKAAEKTAPAVQKLLDAGATLLGKSHTDEIAYSLMGVNSHYGTPINTAAPDRVPGGSSSGSVAAVAAGMTDIGLGSDTGGSVRMPASFCGVYGIRTTHGRIDIDNVMPLAPSFDTVGWFARDPGVFTRTGEAYAMKVPAKRGNISLLIAEDAMERADRAGVESYAPILARLQEKYGAAKTIRLCPTDLSDWFAVFKVCQAAEVWQVHGDWVTKTKPDFGPGIKERFQMAAAISREEHERAAREREKIVSHLDETIEEDAIVIAPSSPGAAPLRDADEASLDKFRMSALELLCPAGLAGLPQVSLPAGRVENAPLGLSLIAGRGRDELLLSVVRDLGG